MKTYYVCFISFFLCVCSVTSHAQVSFHGGSLLLSVSEGSTHVQYATGYNTSGRFNTVNSEHQHGTRDPLILEYGICKHLGLGFTCGTDIYTINPTSYYGFAGNGSPIKTQTSDFTLDADFHLFVTQHTDISAALGFGGFNVKMNGSDYNYNAAQGHISRLGVRGRYYFYKRFGVFGMLTFYKGIATPKTATPDGSMHIDNVTYPLTTRVSGSALEFGLCYRFF